MGSGESGAGLHDFEVLINVCDIFKCCCLTLRVLRQPLWVGLCNPLCYVVLLY